MHAQLNRRHRTGPQRSGLRRTAGIALVIVLWMLALLSVIAGSLVFSSRTEVQITSNLASQAKIEALADAGVYRAIMELARPKTPDPQQWKADGLPRRWQYREAELMVTIMDESGKVDINAAPRPLLVGLFLSVGADNAEALADAVTDWRDPDDFRNPNGAEKEDYLAAGLGYVPANAPFENIEELRQVLGMTDQLYHRLEKAITVYSGQAGLNTAVAPREALLALPGATPEAVDQFISQRQALVEQGLPAPPFTIASTQGYATGTTGSTISIQVEAILSDNTRFLRDAVVRLMFGAPEPMAILAWRAPSVAAKTAPDSVSEKN